MPRSGFRQRLSALVSGLEEEAERNAEHRQRRGTPGLWMTLDALTVVVSAALSVVYKYRTGVLESARNFWTGHLIYGRSAGLFLWVLLGFLLVLILASRRLNLYHPERLSGALREQELSLQACLTSGLLLAGTLYLVHAGDVPRTLVVGTVALVTVLLSARRLIYRLVMARRFESGFGRRNVLIVGTGPEAQALRHHLESIHRLGYAFRGFVDAPGLGEKISADSEETSAALDMVFSHARKLFVDEIILSAPCAAGMVQSLLERARINGIDLRVIPDMFDGLAWNSPIEYIGQFPTIPLHARHVPELGLLIKRAMDLAISAFVVTVLSPLGLIVALLIKLDSPGPIFYTSDRIGKKGLIFHCTKFRTMSIDAEERRAALMHLNERDGVLFKVTNDPRISRVGRFLRKYSIDELPQFLNVLRGDMSVVGPRPPLASEVKAYELEHLRRLDVIPGITGLWQVQARQDPSFSSYVSLDVAYIEKWSLWLDIKIILKTIKVVIAGTGS